MSPNALIYISNSAHSSEKVRFSQDSKWLMFFPSKATKLKHRQPRQSTSPSNANPQELQVQKKSPTKKRVSSFSGSRVPLSLLSSRPSQSSSTFRNLASRPSFADRMPVIARLYLKKGQRARARAHERASVLWGLGEVSQTVVASLLPLFFFVLLLLLSLFFVEVA